MASWEQLCVIMYQGYLQEKIFLTVRFNVLGSFLLGFILFVSFYSGYISPDMRNFLTIGVLGAFTTMSTFSFETLEFFNTNDYWMGSINIILNVGLSIIGVYLGRSLALIMSV